MLQFFEKTTIYEKLHIRVWKNINAKAMITLCIGLLGVFFKGCVKGRF